MAVIGRVANRARDLLFLPGTEHLWRAKLKGRVMALVYHRVDAPENHAFLARGGVPVIRPEALEAELAALRRYGARFLTFTDLRRGHFPDPDEFGVVITFDDGFRDNYTLGLEVLGVLGIPAVFFQCSGMIGGRHLLPEHALYWFADHPETAPLLLEAARVAGWPAAGEAGAGLISQAGRWIRAVPARRLVVGLEAARARSPMEEPAEEIYPDEEDLRRAARAGHEIGSHGNDHLHRSTLDAAGFERELALSRNRIEKAVGMRPAAFSYPFSGYQPGDREICGKYYDQAVTVDERMIDRESDLLALPRFTWPGPARNGLRLRRWLLTGKI